MSENLLPDRRVRKTKEALGRALMDHLRKVPWDEITILMICDRADVARSSFYSHFNGKIDLLDHVIAQQLAVVQSIPPGGTGLQSLLWLVDHVTADRAFFVRMAVSVSGHVVFSRFRMAVRQMLQDELATRQPPVAPDVASFIIGGSFEVILRWTMTKDACSAADLLDSVQRLTARVLPSA